MRLPDRVWASRKLSKRYLAGPLPYNDKSEGGRAVRRSVARSFRCEALSTRSQGGDFCSAGGGGINRVPYCSRH
jgi:hypothetical protein